jgi:CheY-like chemotaxis protein
MSGTKREFIYIDDNKLDCFIAQKVIQNTGISEKTTTFLEPLKAFEFIKTTLLPELPCRNIIFVDIQMPLMNGFEFVEAFESLPEDIRNKYAVFMLSSSINENDHNRVRNYPSVIHLLNKPLSPKILLSLMEMYKEVL